MCENGTVLIQLHAEQPAGKFFYDGSSYFNAVFFTHPPRVMEVQTAPPEKRSTSASIAQKQEFSGHKRQSGFHWSTLASVGGAKYMRKSLLHILLMTVTFAAASLQSGAPAPPPGFGPNVLVFNPGMSVTDIEPAANAIATQQVSNQFGTERYALLF